MEPWARSTPQTTTGLGSELLTVVARLNRLATQRIRLPLPWAQARLLGTIDDQGEARISDLADLDHCSQPTMTTQVRRLEDAGLVARTLDPDDARAVRIRITPKGQQILARCARTAPRSSTRVSSGSPSRTAKLCRQPSGPCTGWSTISTSLPIPTAEK